MIQWESWRLGPARWAGVGIALGVVVMAFGACASKPEARASEQTVNQIDPPGVVGTRQAFTRGTDRLYWVGEGWLARREKESRPIEMPEATRRLLVGHPETGDLSLQPAPLAQEMAAELDRLRQLAERNREAMDKMQRSTEQLAGVAKEMLTRNAELIRWAEKSRADKVGKEATELP